MVEDLAGKLLKRERNRGGGWINDAMYSQGRARLRSIESVNEAKKELRARGIAESGYSKSKRESIHNPGIWNPIRDPAYSRESESGSHT